MQLLQVQFLAQSHDPGRDFVFKLNALLIDQFPELETEAFGGPLRNTINWWLVGGDDFHRLQVAISAAATKANCSSAQ